MKVVKVTIKKGTGVQPMMVYPTRYNAQEVDREGMGPGAVNSAGMSYSGDIGRFGNSETCIIILPDALADAYATDPDMEILTDAEADTLMEENRVKNSVPEEMVNDINRIQAITAKQGASVSLTVEDGKALDINDRTPGVVKSRKTMAEIRAALGK